MVGETSPLHSLTVVVGAFPKAKSTLSRGPRVQLYVRLVLLSSFLCLRPTAKVMSGHGLIAAAQRVEHYEISGYGTARSLARQIGERDVATLLAHTLGEEESSDYLLTELTKPLMQQASSGKAAEDGRTVGARRQKA